MAEVFLVEKPLIDFQIETKAACLFQLMKIVECECCCRRFKAIVYRRRRSIHRDSRLRNKTSKRVSYQHRRFSQLGLYEEANISRVVVQSASALGIWSLALGLTSEADCMTGKPFLIEVRHEIFLQGSAHSVNNLQRQKTPLSDLFPRYML